MNGKFNLFIKCLVCFLACFYSVNIFSAGLWSDSPNNPMMKIGALAGYCKSKIDPFYGILVVNGCNNDSASECQILYKPANYSITNGCTFIKYRIEPDSTPSPAPQQCIAGFKLVAADNTCKPDCENKSGELNASWRAVCEKDCMPLKGRLLNAAANDQGQICADKCRASPVKIVQQCAPAQQLCLGTWAGQYRYDGTKCNGSEISVPAGDMTEDPEQLNEGLKEKLTPFECFKKGLSSGTVNGKTICIPNNGQGDTKSKETSTETKTNPDGSTTTTTTTTTKTDSGGKISTETETKTETKNSSGQTTGVASGASKTEEDRESHCKKNPNSESCKSGTASGGCDKVFKCEGDAISCEATKVGWLDFCATEKSRASEVFALADFEKSKLVLDGNKILSYDGKEASAVSNALGMNGSNTFDFKDLIDTDGFLSGGVLSDRTFVVDGRSFLIPFSKMNYWLKLLGDFAVMITFMICIRIVLGGFK